MGTDLALNHKSFYLDVSLSKGKRFDNLKAWHVFANMPDKIMEVSPIIQVIVVEPLAFVAPDKDEECILGDIWKGNVTGSEISYNLFPKLGHLRVLLLNAGKMVISS
ncbi:uncharacterized protein LOC110898858 isoform X2 [Helianthus annuus]|uniref:uncharacterized protein LOC110898858 isoform X2 n=1 Tax=Helianthus annuus TaxID=4232 RepID=UPI000B9059CD|nr:uncharacterized protein LOC110898858 isoform X2 [Helianthus annuus]